MVKTNHPRIAATTSPTTTSTLFTPHGDTGHLSPASRYVVHCLAFNQFRDDADTHRHVSAAKRTIRHAVRGSHGAHRGGQLMVSRRLRERAARPHGFRAPLRTHAVSRQRRRRLERAFRAHSARRRYAERIHLVGADELFRDCSVKPTRAGPVAGGESHGEAAAGDDATKTRHTARR